MIMRTVAIAGLIAFGGISACTQFGAKPSDSAATAGNHSKPMGKQRGGIDANGDGLISREEAAAWPKLAQQFDAIDTNKDGRLNREEMHAHHAAAMADHHRNIEARFKAADTDGDGGLTMAEAEAARVMPVMHHFAELDTDKNGKVTIAELQSGGMGHGSQGRHGGHGGQCGHCGQGKHGEGRMEKQQGTQKYY